MDNDLDEFPDPPKKALCPFFLFRSDVYAEARKQNKGMHITDLTILIADMWKKVDPAIKAKYEETYRVNKAEADRLREEYAAKFGEIMRPRRKRKIKKDLAKLSRYFSHKY